MFVLAQAVKLTEELGELHAEILGRLQLQRSSKHRRFNEESLRDELADVILSTAILSQAMGIDLDAAIRNKMNAVDSRMDD
nr:MazG-like family protein [Dietzia sp. CQ4]